MITLSNGHRIDFLMSSGALGFDGRGYPWERVLENIGLIQIPKNIAIVTKTLLFDHRKGNLRWYKPWDAVKFLGENGEVIKPFSVLRNPELIYGVVNAIGLTGPGILWWVEHCYPVIQRQGLRVIVSITGEKKEDVLEMVRLLNKLDAIIGIEFNASCPNTDPLDVKNIVGIFREIKTLSRHPLLLKIGYAQPYLKIVKELERIVEAVSINSVPWRFIFGDKPSPLAKYGGGGVSGKSAQSLTWLMGREIIRETKIPVAGPVWDFDDISRLRNFGFSAVAFGSVMLVHPAWPGKFINECRHRWAVI